MCLYPCWIYNLIKNSNTFVLLQLLKLNLFFDKSIVVLQSISYDVYFISMREKSISGHFVKYYFFGIDSLTNDEIIFSTTSGFSA
jgi:hypothetical protein